MDPKGRGNNAHLWAEANDGGRTYGKPDSKPYDCRELLEFLSRHPEADTPLIRWYIESQQRGREEK